MNCPFLPNLDFILDNSNDLDRSPISPVNEVESNEEELSHNSIALQFENKLDILQNRSELQLLLEQNQFSLPKIHHSFDAGENQNEEANPNSSLFLEKWNIFRKSIKENNVLNKVNFFMFLDNI